MPQWQSISLAEYLGFGFSALKTSKEMWGVQNKDQRMILSLRFQPFMQRL